MGTIKMNVRHSIICSLIGILGFASISYSQEPMEDVVYLKDGSVMRGKIVEQVPGVSLTIKTELGGLYTYSIERVEKITREPKKMKHEMRGHKYPGVAFIFSFFFPGAGQFYNGDLVKAYIQSGIAITTTTIIMVEIFRGLDIPGVYRGPGVGDKGAETRVKLSSYILLLDWLWSMIDAPISAVKINERRKKLYGHVLQFDIGKNSTGVDIRIQNNHLLATVTYHF